MPCKQDHHQQQARDDQEAGDDERRFERGHDGRRHGDGTDQDLTTQPLHRIGWLVRWREAEPLAHCRESIALGLELRNELIERRSGLAAIAEAVVQQDDGAASVVRRGGVANDVGDSCTSPVSAAVGVAEHRDVALFADRI